MSIDKTRIIGNAKKYFDTATKNGFMTDDLMTFLGQDFIEAPATIDSYNNFEGGLIEHILRTAAYAVKINNSLSDEEKVDQTSLLKVCLLHQIGKSKMFVPCQSEWHRKNLGRMYEFREKDVVMKTGELSIYYAISHGVTLTEEEFKTIMSFDGENNTMLGDLLKIGNMLAIRYSKNTFKK